MSLRNGIMQRQYILGGRWRLKKGWKQLIESFLSWVPGQTLHLLDSAELCAHLAKNNAHVPACVTCLHVHMSTCLTYSHVPLPMYFVCLRPRVSYVLAYLCAHMTTCLECLHADTPTCFLCLRAHVPNCLALLRAYVQTCLWYSRDHVPACLAC